jgi:uncharacterized membrane protein HdeD (DUF308 family)
VLRGGLAIAFGVCALLLPWMTLAALALVFGIYALLDGVAAVAMGTRNGTRDHAWLLLLEGLAGVGVALAAFAWSRTAGDLLAVAVAFWAISTGILEVVMSVRLRRELPAEVLFGAAGTTSIVLGIAIFFWHSSHVAVVLLGSYGLLFGALLLAQSLRLGRGTGPVGPQARGLGGRPRVA